MSEVLITQSDAAENTLLPQARERNAQLRHEEFADKQLNYLMLANHLRYWDIDREPDALLACVITLRNELIPWCERYIK